MNYLYAMTHIRPVKNMLCVYILGIIRSKDNNYDDEFDV